MGLIGSAASPVGMQIFSVRARPMQFRDCHMRSDSSATRDYVTVASNCLLAKNAGLNNDLTILCDSGPGLHLPANVRSKLGISDKDILEESLASFGVNRKDIQVYIPSHLHWDHTGWAFEGDRFCLPNAHVVMSQQALQDNIERSTQVQDASFLPNVPAILEGLKAEDRLTLIDAKDVPLSGEGANVDWLGDGIRFYFSRGHSDCQMHSVFMTATGTIVFGGDFFPTAWHVSPEHYMPQFDQRDKDRLIQDKRAFLPRAIARGWHLYFYHDPDTLSAQVVETDGEYSAINRLSEVKWAATPLAWEGAWKRTAERIGGLTEGKAVKLFSEIVEDETLSQGLLVVMQSNTRGMDEEMVRLDTMRVAVGGERTVLVDCFRSPHFHEAMKHDVQGRQLVIQALEKVGIEVPTLLK